MRDLSTRWFHEQESRRILGNFFPESVEGLVYSMVCEQGEEEGEKGLPCLTAEVKRKEEPG